MSLRGGPLPTPEGRRHGIGAWLKAAAAFPLAYIGGSVVFGMLAQGTWIAPLLEAVMQPCAFDGLLLILTWLVRLGVLYFLLTEWAFEQ